MRSEFVVRLPFYDLHPSRCTSRRNHHGSCPARTFAPWWLLPPCRSGLSACDGRGMNADTERFRCLPTNKDQSLSACGVSRQCITQHFSALLSRRDKRRNVKPPITAPHRVYGRAMLDHGCYDLRLRCFRKHTLKKIALCAYSRD
jgi:hypothetical protein